MGAEFTTGLGGLVAEAAEGGSVHVATSKSSPQQQTGTPIWSQVRVVRIRYPQPGHRSLSIRMLCFRSPAGA